MTITDGPVLSADTESLSLRHPSSKPIVVVWREICRISGYKLDLVSRIVTVVVLDTECGEFIELMDDWTGFEDTAKMMASTFFGLPPDWIDHIRALEPDKPALEVWTQPA